MSGYNTRRTPTGGRRVGNTQTQVMYHSGSVGNSIGRGNSRLPPNQGYSTGNAQNYPQQQFVSQGYSTAPPPAPPAQKSSPAPAAPVQQMQVTPPPPTPQPSEPSVKVDPEPNPQQQEKQQEESNSEDGQPQKPHWRKKGPTVKVSRRTRKRRQNARLRRLLIPKNALMFLNELHSGTKYTCQERVNALSQFVYTVNVEVDGKVFTGQGMSKLAAKSQASENALRALVLDMVSKTQNLMETTTESNSEDIDMIEEETKESICGDDTASETSQRKSLPEDDFPWGSLAAFALHKLFAEWQQQGAQVPLAKTPGVGEPSYGISAPGSAPMKKIPDDASKRHPVLLLNHIRPGSLYKETYEGIPPNMIFTTSVNVDGKEYVGTGKNKKEAKKECARAVLAALGIQSEI